MKKTVGASVWANMDCADIAKMINRDWEHAIKKDFDGTPRTWVVDIPKRRKRGQLKLKQSVPSHNALSHHLALIIY